MNVIMCRDCPNTSADTFVNVEQGQCIDCIAEREGAE